MRGVQQGIPKFLLTDHSPQMTLSSDQYLFIIIRSFQGHSQTSHTPSHMCVKIPHPIAYVCKDPNEEATTTVMSCSLFNLLSHELHPCSISMDKHHRARRATLLHDLQDALGVRVSAEAQVPDLWAQERLYQRDID